MFDLYKLSIVILIIISMFTKINFICAQDDGGEDDFGTGDYSDTGGTEPGTGSGGDGDGGEGPGFQPNPETPRRNGGGEGGGSIPRGGDVPPGPRGRPYPRPRPYPPPRSYPPTYPRTNPRPWARGGGTNGTTPKPWLVDGIEEDTLWNRLFNFFSNLSDDVGRVEQNEYIDFIRYQLNRFIDVFRYQGYDRHDHFYHCTQRVGGCPFYPDRPRTTSTSTTESPVDEGGTDEGGTDENDLLRRRRTQSGNVTRTANRRRTGRTGNSTRTVIRTIGSNRTTT